MAREFVEMIDRSLLTWREHALYLGDELLAQIVPDPIMRRRITPRPMGRASFLQGCTSPSPATLPLGFGRRASLVARHVPNRTASTMAQFRYGATSTCRQATGRSASLIGGFGGEGGSGLGCSTASVNHQSSSFPQPSSGDGGGWP
jgi:hypothetical protein